MSNYCEVADLKSRLTLAGFKFAVNRDGGSTVTDPEIAMYVTPAIERAGTEIDAAIELHYDTSAARGNSFLKFLAVDLATVTACTNGGRSCPDHYFADQKRARETLTSIKAGTQRIPGLSRDVPNEPVAEVYGDISVVNFGDGDS